ncbi:MAG: YggS family pyridoxal phosphate-dependent enzyme [Desulfobacterales bacterium]
MEERLKNIQNRINRAAMACGRDPGSIRLVAASKTVPASRVEEAIRAGVATLGENYVQEAREKINTLSSFDVSWHLIGHLQTNKAKYAVRLFDLIHTVGSFKLARELNKQAQKNAKIQSVLIQVNISGELTKSGSDPKETINLLKEISPLENIQVKGLMTMPPFFDQPQKARPFFGALRQMRQEIIARQIPHILMDELSMGMTGDFEAAIEEGATMVRIGTAIFGSRN